LREGIESKGILLFARDLSTTFSTPTEFSAFREIEKSWRPCCETAPARIDVKDMFRITAV
jgi:hypothetical protein